MVTRRTGHICRHIAIIALPVLAAVSVTAANRAHARSRAAITAECFLLQQIGRTDVVLSGGEECGRKSAPASTFKIPHALIALEAGVLRREEVIRWDGRDQPFAAWERDHSLDTAMKASVYWFFQRTASLLGRERMLNGLRTLKYGDTTFTGSLTSFWIDGGLTISPRQQLDFLRRLFADEVYAGRANVEVVKGALLMPHGTISNAAGIHPFPLDWPADTQVRAKTGNTRDGKGRVSWLVGHLATGGRGFVFVSRVRSVDAPLETTAGAEAALRHLDRHVPPR